MAEQAPKIMLQAPGSAATLTTRDEKQAESLVKSGWARLDASKPAPKAPVTEKKTTQRRAPKKPAAKPVESTDVVNSTESNE